VSGHPIRSTLDSFQRLFYAARENASGAQNATVRFVARMNDDTLKALGREVAMGGVDAPPGLPAACEEAARKPDGPTGIFFWNVELTLDRRLGDSEICLDEMPVH
jgi:hypothetical protein